MPDATGRESQPPSGVRKRFLWVLFPAVGGLAVYNYISKGDAEHPVVFDNWAVQLITSVPTRALSRAWGAANEIELPVWLRRPLLGAYASAFHCNLEEAADSDLSHYPHLQAFFGRQLRAGVRPLGEADMVSPADCRVLHFGPVERDRIEQVKGVTYSLEHLLGARLQPSADKQLFQIVLYLAPGDYHNFHSPTDWDAAQLRHYPGHLLSVSPAAARKIKGLFAINERVVLEGRWKHGAFAFVAVGAYNVGSIFMTCAPDLATNATTAQQLELPLGRVRLGKGEQVGGFRLGSTVVLVFEAPPTFSFTVRPGEKLKYGQSLGAIGSAVASA